MRHAQAEALAAHDAIVAEAVTQFAGQGRAAEPDGDAGGAACVPGSQVVAASEIARAETMPTDACRFFSAYTGYGTTMRPTPGNCCAAARVTGEI